MKPILSVELTTQVTSRGSMTRKVSAGPDVKLERMEDGVMVTESSMKDGRKGTRSFWVPDGNIVSLHFGFEAALEPKPEQKK